MPRQRKRDTSPDTRYRNMLEAQGRPAIAGLSRIGPGLAQSFGGLAPSIVQPGADSSDGAGSPQLLVLSASADSIASGGDHVTFDTIVAQHGWGGSPVLTGDAWTHPVEGVYVLIYEHAWDTYTSGGTVRLELDGVLVPEGVIMGGTDGQEGRASIAYVAEAGQAGRIHVVSGSGSAQSCDAVVRVAIPDPRASTASEETLDGNAVAVSTQGSPSVANWSGYPTGWTDPAAEWIWHTALVSGNRPGESAWMWATLTLSTGRGVTVEVTADNTFTLFVNGVEVVSGSNYQTRQTASVTLLAGDNLFQAEATNVDPGTPAGFILSVRRTTDNEIILRTADDGRWHASTTEPAGWPV